MSLSIGILGLPNVGKSTIFNALTRAQNAEAANYPFCTIEPNKAVVPVPDPRVDKLATMVIPKKTVYATVDFMDIAGLVKGASKGEGLGNKFLSNVREADALLHVIRCFHDDNVVHVDGSIDPVRDLEVIETELILADYQTWENRLDRVKKQGRADKAAAATVPEVEKLLIHLGEGKPAISFPGRNSELFKKLLKECPLLTDKKIIYCANVDEAAMAKDNDMVKAVRAYADAKGADTVKISAKMEEDLIGMDEKEANEFLKEYGVEESGLNQVIHKGYHTLGLASYLTAGPKEVHAWTIHQGWKAPQAAGVIHTDFERGFIRAQVISYADYIEHGGETACKEKGLMRTEGKEYVVKDGDIIEFLFNV
ncbi:MAG: redox-regulated ATPase YchF [Kiritimatiellales bacterium]|nr:redox-regulated ATPase YchF [Kiritimatiellales bacterium]